MNDYGLFTHSWVQGDGDPLISTNPATNECYWNGNSASKEQVDTAVQNAKNATTKWKHTPLSERISIINEFKNALQENRTQIETCISIETGKPLWESKAELGAMIAKIDISIEAYHERCPTKDTVKQNTHYKLEHRPHGVLAILGPFNFPGHLPNGHIIPALLAGNTIVFKPSPHTPKTGAKLIELWNKTSLPKGVLNMVQGADTTGKQLCQHPDIHGILFTGSKNVGHAIAVEQSKRPHLLLALEMGGNNPIIVGNITNIEAAAYTIVQSAFISTGQRCTCARRLIMIKNKLSEALLNAIIYLTQNLKIGPYTSSPEPFMGPLINTQIKQIVLQEQDTLIQNGASPLLTATDINPDTSFISPGILDVTATPNKHDNECFGPLLQVQTVDTLDSAIQEANNTQYGLSAAILSDKEEEYLTAKMAIDAGVINWNKPTTGASSTLPFGGIGHSGNLRPSAYYAADYCAYPVASIEETQLELPETPYPGILNSKETK